MDISSIASLLSSVGSVSSLTQLGESTINTDGSVSASFSDILDALYGDMTDDVNVTDSQLKSDALALALGLADDNLHTIEINAVKAELALRTLISVRNKALEAYSEIMRMTL